MQDTDRQVPAAIEAAKTITISTGTATRDIRLSKPRLRALYAGGALALIWTLTASAGFVMSLIADPAPQASTDAMEAAYEARIAALTAERDKKAFEALSAQDRFATAMEKISEQQMLLLTSMSTQNELRTTISLMQAKLASAVAARDTTETQLDDMRLTLSTLEADLSAAPARADELHAVVAAMSDALDAAVKTRDTQRSDLSRLESEVASLELRMQINAERQEQLLTTLEDAVTASFRPLEEMFKRSGMDVDNLIAGVRRNYSGVGGPMLPATSAALGLANPELTDRFSSLMQDMDRMNMMRIAATKLPYAMPVSQAHRFTSGFGTRRDPKTGGRRAHNGIDLAGPRGTPIEATADGVVVFAGRQSGFGKMIKIRHEYGYETLYAHLNKINVEVGERIARGDHIGDMGTTGRSTGVHLHYEVRLGGTPVNPMKYIKAARDVF